MANNRLLTLVFALSASIAMVSIVMGHREHEKDEEEGVPNAPLGVSLIDKRVEKHQGGSAATSNTVQCRNEMCLPGEGEECVDKKSAGGVIECKYRVKFGNDNPDKNKTGSCRCAELGYLVDMFGSAEEAWNALSKESGTVSEEDYKTHMKDIGLPAYTATWEFGQADSNNDDSLDRDEFFSHAQEVSEILDASKDLALGTVEARCCCGKSYDDVDVSGWRFKDLWTTRRVSFPKDICIEKKKDTETAVWTLMESYYDKKKIFVGDNEKAPIKTTKSQSIKWNGTARQNHPDVPSPLCREIKPSSETRARVLLNGAVSDYSFGRRSDLNESIRYIQFGDGIYVRAKKQTLKFASKRECVTISSGEGATYVEKDRVRVLLNQCTFDKEEQSTSWERFTKIGKKGNCLKRDELAERMLVSHLTCPRGTFHRSPEGKQKRAESSPSICDCQDECP